MINANIIARINKFNEKRIPKILRMKYDAMARNAFAFFRGTNHIFWEDLKSANLPVSSPYVWTCGDLHIENFGTYKSDNRLVYFDLNDFDDAVLAPCHTEILRLVCSIYIAFDSLDIDLIQAEKLARLFLGTYKATLQAGKAIYLERQTAEGLLKEFLQKIHKRKKEHILKRKTIKKKKSVKVNLALEKHKRLEDPLKNELITHIQSWLSQDNNTPYNYEVVDAAFRLAGVGSLGLKRYMFLLKSTNTKGSKFILLDMKQAEEPAPQKYNLVPQPKFESQAERIREICIRMQNTPPALLSTTTFHGESYIVQELQPQKDSINFYLLKDRYKDMCRVISDMARLTASAHLRSSGRQGSSTTDELIEFAMKNSWEDYLIKYASSNLPVYKAYFADFLHHHTQTGAA